MNLMLLIFMWGQQYPKQKQKCIRENDYFWKLNWGYQRQVYKTGKE
jgi:hypothetical protein